MIASKPLTERAALESEALELGWVINQRGQWTRFDFGRSVLNVQWSECGCARYGTLHTDGQVSAIRDEWPGQGGPVGGWVQMMLRAIVDTRPAEVAG